MFVRFLQNFNAQTAIEFLVLGFVLCVVSMLVIEQIKVRRWMRRKWQQSGFWIHRGKSKPGCSRFHVASLPDSERPIKKTKHKA